MKRKKLKHSRLLEVLDYSEDTGIFTWKISTGGMKIGEKAGGEYGSGHEAISIDNERFFSHRLAWFYVHGYLPENEIDHINRDRKDNRISNLREVTRRCNLINRGVQKNNSSGVTGVYYHIKSKKFIARIKMPEKDINLGSFISFSDAVLARWNAEVKYNFPNCCSSSSSYAYLKNHKLLPTAQATK